MRGKLLGVKLGVLGTVLGGLPLLVRFILNYSLNPDSRYGAGWELVLIVVPGTLAGLLMGLASWAGVVISRRIGSNSDPVSRDGLVLGGVVGALCVGGPILGLLYSLYDSAPNPLITISIAAMVICVVFGSAIWFWVRPREAK